MRFNSAFVACGVLALVGGVSAALVKKPAGMVVGGSALDALNQPRHQHCSTFQNESTCIQASTLDIKQLPCTWCPDNTVLSNCRYDPMDIACGGNRTVAACDMTKDFGMMLKTWNQQLDLAHFVMPDVHKELPWCDLCDATFSFRVDAYLKVVELRFGVSAREYDQIRNSLILAFKRFSFAAVKDLPEQQDGINAFFDDLYFVLERCNPQMQIWGHHGMLQQATDILFAHFAGAALSVAGVVGVSPIALAALEVTEIAIDATIKAYGGLDILDILMHEMIAHGPGYIYWPAGYAGDVIENIVDLPGEIIHNPEGDSKPSQDPRPAVVYM